MSKNNFEETRKEWNNKGFLKYKKDKKNYYLNKIKKLSDIFIVTKFSKNY